MSPSRATGGKFRFPWWGSILLAVLCYCLLRYVVPEFQPANPLLARLVHAAPFFAPIVAIPLLLLAAKQLYDADKGENNDAEAEDDGKGHDGKD